MSGCYFIDRDIRAKNLCISNYLSLGKSMRSLNQKSLCLHHNPRRNNLFCPFEWRGLSRVIWLTWVQPRVVKLHSKGKVNIGGIPQINHKKACLSSLAKIRRKQIYWLWSRWYGLKRLWVMWEVRTLLPIQCRFSVYSSVETLKNTTGHTFEILTSNPTT